MRLRFQREALDDLRGAKDWYEQQFVGLGDTFLADVNQLAQRLTAHPLAYPLVHEDVRRAPVSRFPFCLYYIAEDRVIRVLAVMHVSRVPDAWRVRH